MIWQVLAVFLIFSGGLCAWLWRAGVSRATLAIVSASCVVAGLGYVWMGEPGRADAPLDTRIADLAARDPATLTPAETLARLDQLKRDRPDDPQPHFFIGELMRAQGRDEDAVRAYQSALRRDGDFVPALEKLADALTHLSAGRVTPDAQAIYAHAFALDPTNLRVGFMVGLASWQTGEAEGARAHWEGLSASLAADDPRRTMLSAWIATAEGR